MWDVGSREWGVPSGHWRDIGGEVKASLNLLLRECICLSVLIRCWQIGSQLYLSRALGNLTRGACTSYWTKVFVKPLFCSKTISLQIQCKLLRDLA